MADPPRRVSCFDGLMLTAADFAAEQQHHRGMRHLHNRLHGYALEGLDVEVTDGDVVVGAGTAMDALGREIVEAEPLRLVLEPVCAGEAGEPWLGELIFTGHEDPESPVPGPDGRVAFTRRVEQPQLAVVAAGAAPAAGLLLARSTRSTDQTVKVDTSVRRPLGPG
ncbi:MAG: hypothetical protein ABJA89_14005 [Lapillicoccus sp.]